MRMPQNDLTPVDLAVPEIWAMQQARDDYRRSLAERRRRRRRPVPRLLAVLRGTDPTH